MAQTDNRDLRTRRLLVDYPRAVPIFIFLLVAAITALSVWAIERGESDRRHAEMTEKARIIASALERRSDASKAYLRASAALFGTYGEVRPRMFRRYVDELGLESNFRGTDGVGWARAIKASEYRGEDVADGVRLFPEPEEGRELLVPVTLLYPSTMRSRRALGFDMASENTRRAALEQARRTIRPTASGPVTLLQEGQTRKPGFLVYMPVFRGVGSSRDLMGFIYSPFNAKEVLLDAVNEELPPGLTARLYAGLLSPRNLLAKADGDPDMAGPRVTHSVQFANREFVLSVHSTMDRSLSVLSMATLLFGLAVASLLMIVARLLTQQVMEDQASLSWLQEQNSIRNSLTRELNHRVKNTLANVLSIIALTRRRSEDLDEFADALDGRVRALSATHDLLTQSEWGTTPVRAVIEAELAPYTGHRDGGLVLSGPDVDLAPNDALSLGLAIHELATNAAKYGALSVPDGKIGIEWALTADGVARVEWSESNGPPVAQERRRGFGTDLIEKIVAHELRHPVILDFDPSGVRCVLLVPVRQLSDFALRARHLKDDQSD